jgi:condensin complex subunit 1
VKLFLHELHTKGNNNIYNLFPKAISRLSKEFQDLGLDEFQNIAKNLLSHIDKDKQTESIVDKLCNKFRSSENTIEWRNTAYCLTQMKYTEKIFIKLLEHYDGYKDKLLVNPEVKAYFIQIGVNLRK